MWDQRYEEPGYAYGTQPNDFLASAAAHIPPGEVICIAAGEGRNAVFLAEQGFTVTAVDASVVGLEKTRELARARGVQVNTVHADLADFVLGEGRWSGIVGIFAHLPPDIRRPLHASIPAALRPGGVVVMEAYRPEQLEHKTGGPPALPMLYTREELVGDMAGLTWIRAEAVEREIREGRYHKGLSATVQIIGQRPAIQ